MYEFLEYIVGRSKTHEGITFDEGVGVALAPDPFFDFIIRLQPSYASLKNFREYLGKEPARLVSADNLLMTSFRLPEAGHVAFREFLPVVRQLSHSPLKSAKALHTWANHWTIIGYYSCLILAYCYQHGIGVIRSEEKAFTYLEMAITFSNKQKSAKTFPFITDEFLENFTLKNNSKKILSYRIKLLELERKETTISSHTRDHAKNMAYLDEFFAPVLTSLDQDDPDYENQKSRMLEFVAITKKKRIDYKIAYYIKRSEELTQYSFNQQNYISHYKALSEDSELKDFPDSLQKILDALNKLCDTKYQLRDYENATRFYSLYFQFSKSPAVAIILGEMAANGHLLGINESDGTVVEQEKRNSDFIQARHYYKIAIDLAIDVLDFTTAAKAISAYKEIQSNLAKSDQLNLDLIVREAIDYFKEFGRFIGVESPNPPEPLILSHNSALQTKIYKIAQSKQLIGSKLKFAYLIKDLLTLMISNLVGQGYLSELRSFYLAYSPTAQLEWCITILKLLLDYSLQKPPPQILHSSLDEITVEFQKSSANGSTSITLENLQMLLEEIVKQDIHTLNAPSVNRFFEGLNIYLVDRIKNEITGGTVEGLKGLKAFYDKVKILSGEKNTFINRADEISYWIERNIFENTFKEGKKTATGHGTLFNIYALSASKKANEYYNPLYGSPLNRLKILKHREAFLKIAELRMMESDTGPADSMPRDISIAVSLIQTLTCPQPVDNLGIYTQLCVERMKALKEKVADEKKFNDQHRTNVKFYYGLALLITDPKKYKEDSVPLFEGKQFDDLIPIIFGLFNDPILSFSNEVKREVLTKIDILLAQKLIDKKFHPEARALSAKLPPLAMPVETTASPTPAAVGLTTPSQDFTSTVVDSSADNSLALDHPYFAMSPIDVPHDKEEVPPPSFSSPPDDAESVARLKSEVDSLRLLYQQSLNAVAQKDALLQQKDALLQRKDAALETAQLDLTKAQKEIDRLNKQAAKFSDLRSKFIEQQKALAAEFDAPIDGDVGDSRLVAKS